MIELASIENLNEIMDIINLIKKEMREENNPQWGVFPQDYPNLDVDYIDYPNRVFVEQDINSKELYVYKENNIVKGIISICKETDEYQRIVNASNQPALVIHRLAIHKDYRKLGIAQKLISFAERKAHDEEIKLIKIDTEQSNDKMNKLLIKLGYEFKDKFTLDDYPGVYIYYEKNIK